jgi:hypothetical protein
MTDWREQQVANETTARDLNEWIDESNEGPAATTPSPFVCECSDDACEATIRLTHGEYEDVRSRGTYFAIALDHESPDLDVIVAEHAGFTIVRKLPGMPARVAMASDPRRGGVV